MKALKIFGIAVGCIVLVLLIIGGVAYALMRGSSELASQVKPVVTSAEAAQRLDTKLEDLEKAAKAASPGTTVSLILTEEEVNSKIAAELSKADIPENIDVKDVTVNLRDGEVLASARVNISGIQTTVGVKAKVEVADGKASIVVQNLDLGKLPVPQALKDRITGLIPGDGKISLSDIPVDLQDIQIVDGQIVLRGVTR